MTVRQDSGGSIRLTDSDLIEVGDDADEVALPDEVTGKQSPSELPLPTATPDASPSHEVEAPSAEGSRDEVTNVSERARRERAWVDLHAVVDDEGRLRLPEDAARALQPGAIVEVRVAAWALDPAENA